MKILYVAKHNSGGNDDEGAITHSLRTLGHEVICIREADGRRVLEEQGHFVLFHKWFDIETLSRLRVPAVFWYFDLVHYEDEGIGRRNRNRVEWMEKTTPLVKLGCCTDGDWVNQDNSGKLVRLLQGADERFIGMGRPAEPRITVLFTGGRAGGKKRTSHIRELSNEYRENFKQVTGVHGRRLASLIASATVVIAPDSPITDNYWSNRVYLTLGFGGFLLHKYAETLTAHYTHNKEIIYYTTRDEVYELIEKHRMDWKFRRDVAENAVRRTRAEHTYTHRCKDLIKLVKERVL